MASFDGDYSHGDLRTRMRNTNIINVDNMIII